LGFLRVDDRFVTIGRKLQSHRAFYRLSLPREYCHQNTALAVGHQVLDVVGHSTNILPPIDKHRRFIIEQQTADIRMFDLLLMGRNPGPRLFGDIQRRRKSPVNEFAEKSSVP
jgi:hypothetical protein